MLHSKPSHSPHPIQAHFYHPSSHPTTHQRHHQPNVCSCCHPTRRCRAITSEWIGIRSVCQAWISVQTPHSLDITISIQDLAASSHLAPAVGSTNCVYLNPIRLLAQRVATGKRSMHRHASPRQSTCSATADTFLRSIAQTLRQSNNTHKHTCP